MRRRKGGGGVEGGKVWKRADRTGICPDREPGPGPDMRASVSEMPHPSLL